MTDAIQHGGRNSESDAEPDLETKQVKIDDEAQTLGVNLGLLVLQYDTNHNETLSASEIDAALASPRTSESRTEQLEQLKKYLPELAAMSDSVDGVTIDGIEKVPDIYRIIQNDALLSARAKAYGEENFAAIDRDHDGILTDNELRDHNDGTTGDARVLVAHLLKNNHNIKNLVSDGSFYERWISTSGMTRLDLREIAPGVIADAGIESAYKSAYMGEAVKDGANIGGFMGSVVGLAYGGPVGIVALGASGVVVGGIGGAVVGNLEGGYYYRRDNAGVRAFIDSVAKPA